MDSLGSPPWLTAQSTCDVVAALEAARPGCARFVGGCVRNAVMGRPVDDIDIATQLTPSQVLEALAAANIRAIPTGIEHGTITAVHEQIPFEITTLRRDVETDGRRAVVAFTEDWREDALRRDFRLNALYAEPDGTLHDPVGGGLDDARAGRVIFIGNGDERLREDYLRILRFFRFNAWYGAGIDADGLAACARQKEGLNKIAAERIWKEFKKLLKAPQPASAVQAMAQTGILKHVLPWNMGTDRFAAICDLTPNAMQRFMALVPQNTETVSLIASKLRLSNKERGQLDAWAETAGAIQPGLNDAEARAFIYQHGSQAFDDAIALHPGTTPETYAAAKAISDAWIPPEFPLGGDDALAIGLSGAAIGNALHTLVREWIESDFSLSRESLMERLRALG